ncbi:twin-arginine translocase subunit TatC [Bacillus sp. 31A1R]|uniref:Sec-independent protein translocase protein TatC n=1 Tax=Robertmurraya mangrovi TaxID=3098077 RepID=A0ABU5J3W0_9BACI|nr:twin-arginine translocase subunit TatC [Bacillus sp. 31A1R]MDZ5474047.1 twin-arginine translocase subunit TatC [Bacillus sp. 31A1R]
MEDKDIHVIAHFEELRKRLMITAITFLLFLMVSFVFVKDIYHFLVKGLDFKLAVLGPSDILWVYFMLASVVGIAATIPVAAHQLWLFVKPALSKKERKLTLSYIPALFLLFITGISFGYFILFPLVLKFLITLSGDMFTTFFTTEKYFTFLIHLTLPFGLLFELPVVVMFLTTIGIINPVMLQKSRKYAYFALIVTAVLITPPDFISDFLVTIPLLLLYEASISLSKMVYNRKMKNTVVTQESSM